MIKKILVIFFILIIAIVILASAIMQGSNKNGLTNQSNNLTGLANDTLKDNQNQTYEKSVYNNSQYITNKTNITNKKSETVNKINTSGNKINTSGNKTNITNKKSTTGNKSNTNKTAYTYNRQESKNTITYTFNTGDVLELKISNNSISKNNAIYKTNAKGNYITIAGEKYERLTPNRVAFLSLIIDSITNKTLKVNETLKLKNNYSFVIYEINSQGFKSRILKNNKVVRTDIINKDSIILSIGFWKEIDEFKKQKILWIEPTKINRKDIIVNITQYGDRRIYIPESKWGEFQVTNITDDSITMKNFQTIKVEKGKELSLMNGKIKIKI